jgi:hypothetical protein
VGGLFQVKGGFVGLRGLGDAAFEDAGDGEERGAFHCGGDPDRGWGLGLFVAAATVELAEPVGPSWRTKLRGFQSGEGSGWRRRGGAMPVRTRR